MVVGTGWSRLEPVGAIYPCLDLKVDAALLVIGLIADARVSGAKDGAVSTILWSTLQYMMNQQ